MVPVEECRHLPERVVQRLANIPFVLVEGGKATEFTDRRACETCSKWCQNDDCIRCAHCGEAYHLLCVDMDRKPSKGYAWQCPKCLKAARIAAAEHNGEVVSPLVQGNHTLEIPPISLTNGITLDNGTGNGIFAISHIDTVSSQPAEHATPPTPYKNVWPFHYLGDYSRLDAAADGTSASINFILST